MDRIDLGVRDADLDERIAPEPEPAAGGSARARLLVAVLLCLTFVGYPLAALVSMATGESSVPVYLYRGVQGMLGIVVIAWSLGHGLPRRRLATAAMIAFWVAYGIRLYVDQDLIGPALGHRMSDFLLMTASMGVVPAISGARAPVAAGLQSHDDCDALSRTLVTLVFWAAWPILILTMMLAMGRGGLEPAGFRLQTDKLNPISLGNLGVITLLSAIFWVAMNRARSRTVEALKWLMLLAVCALGIAGVLLAASRGPMVGGAAAAIVAMLFWSRARLFFVGLIFVGLMTATFGVALTTVEEMTEFRPLQRIDSMMNSAVVEDESVELRRIAMSNALEQFLENPVAGDSLIERVTAYYPHNLYVESLMALGVLGTAPLVLVSLLASRSCLRIVRRGRESLFLVSLFVLYFMTAMVSGDISGSQFFWAAIGFLCGLDVDNPQPARERAGTPTFVTVGSTRW